MKNTELITGVKRRRLSPGNLVKIKLGRLTARQRRSHSAITIAECAKNNDKWEFAGDKSKRAPRVRININDVFLVLDIIIFEEKGLVSEAAVLLFGEKTIVCDLCNFKRANKKELLSTSSVGILNKELGV